MLGMEVASFSLRYSGRKNSYLCRISYLALWLIVYLCFLLLSDRIIRQLPIFGRGVQPSYLFSPLAFVLAWFDLYVLSALLRLFKNERSWRVLPIVLWLLASVMSTWIPLRPWPGVFSAFDFVLPLVVLATTGVLTVTLWKYGVDRLEEGVGRIFESR